jgi:16S rRNA (guanine527-N7)-methyltransferase
MEKKKFTSNLLNLAREKDIPLSLHQAHLCYEHSSLMLKWNERINLTRITDDEEIVTKHFLDSFIPARFLPHKGLVVDVGTGAGFPGIPLKILHPELEMLLLETHRKRVSFLKVVLSRLGLDNIWALQGRWEAFHTIPHPLVKKNYALVVMRALELQEECLTLFASKVLEPGGLFAWWAGPHLDPRGKSFDLSQQIANMVFQGCFTYELPLNAGSRQLFLWKRSAS